MPLLGGTGLVALVASIPSPSSNEIVLGPLHLRAYGLMIAIGVIVAVWIAQRRWAARGGDPDDITTIALWAVPAGLIGSRIYHVVTDYNRLYCGTPKCEGSLWPEAFQIWSGGLGIPGGILGGLIGGLIVVKVKKWPTAELMDVCAPAIAVAQAIGRLGNWFNQEVFGRPTTLPWGLEIDPGRRGEDYIAFSTFHPTFLYEGLWNLLLAYLLVRLDATRRLQPGRIFALYVGGYFLGRLWVESLRIDTASELFGLRVNTVLSLVVIVAMAAYLAIKGLTRPDGELRPTVTALPVPATVSAGAATTSTDTTTTVLPTDPSRSGDAGGDDDLAKHGDRGDKAEDGGPAAGDDDRTSGEPSEASDTSDSGSSDSGSSDSGSSDSGGGDSGGGGGSD
jgi:prolipoprotein diacylglyceryl transferase